VNQARERLQDRAAAVGLDLDARTIERLLAYFELLRRWNRRLNLTGFTVEHESDESIDRLLVEPVVASRLSGAQERVVDVGSGGGSPIIPFALALTPSPTLTLVESRSKKGTFLREALRVAGLDGRVVTGRFEDLAGRAEEVGSYSALTIRAVRTDADIWLAAQRVLAPGGRVFWFHGEGQERPMQAGFQWASAVPLVPSLKSFLSIASVERLATRWPAR
jgi:16S rRNA (guanine527-N7)-methyltransferase